MSNISDPLSVRVHRGGAVESSHLVHAVVATSTQVIDVWGDASRPTMPRSAIKSIQALPMLALGAAEAFDVTDDEVALAASSHSAEDGHVTAVSQWLHRIGLNESALECGPSDPISADAMHALYRRGEKPQPIHNCCSGKHTGFMTLARHLAPDREFELPGYLAPEHGVQRLVRDAQAQMTGVDLDAQTPVIDGCGVPVYQFPLASLAQAMARLVTPQALPPMFVGAAARVTAVLPSRSWWVSGTRRTDDFLTELATEPLIIKGGAEAVSMGALPDRGIGFALKCEDGTHRGVDEAVAALLHNLGALAEPVSPNSPIKNRAGTNVGHFSVTL